MHRYQQGASPVSSVDGFELLRCGNAWDARVEASCRPLPFMRGKYQNARFKIWQNQPQCLQTYLP